VRIVQGHLQARKWIRGKVGLHWLIQFEHEDFFCGFKGALTELRSHEQIDISPTLLLKTVDVAEELRMFLD
jgi:hypothetical protein